MSTSYLHWSCVVVAVALQAQLPPAYPRAGATKLLENARVIVWDIAWLKQTYPLHRHPYELTGVYYTNGDRMIVSQDGTRRPVTTAAWQTAFQARGVTHIEEGASDVPLRAVFAELKEEAARGDASPPTPEAFPRGEGKPLVDNARVTIWEFVPPPAATAPSHTHTRDAVVVSFTGGKPAVAFVERGTAHRGEGPAGAERVYVYELK